MGYRKRERETERIESRCCYGNKPHLVELGPNKMAALSQMGREGFRRTIQPIASPRNIQVMVDLRPIMDHFEDGNY